LPIGLAKTAVTKPLLMGEHTGEFIGLTCAACHNAQPHYQGKRVRIDGRDESEGGAERSYALIPVD
jgi:hypothetical protein